jgi:hypothetical protein
VTVYSTRHKGDFSLLADCLTWIDGSPAPTIPAKKPLLSGPIDGSPFTHEEVDAAFRLVSSRKDWKAPISATIPEAEREVVAFAVHFFTATEARFSPGPDADTLRVAADGYRAGPAR